MKIPMKLADSEEMLTFKTAFKFPPVNVGGEKDHSKLENLDYANSGHTGFASSEDIPTKVSQLENDKGYIDNSASNLVNYELKGKTGTNLGVSIDNTTYVMTIELKNTAGDVISTGSVDLPLESMVIGASYDDSTKEVVLTLQSGEEVRFSVADLVSGLVSQSTFDTKMNEISQEFSHKFDMPYYYEYNGDTDFEDTSETTLAMFNEIKKLMEAGQKPCIIVKKGATGANSYITYHFVVPQFGSLDTTYIMLKGSPVRKDGSTFNLVALNCEKDPETNQIKRVYEKKADGSIEIGNSEETIDFIMTDTTAIKIQKGQKFLDYYLKNGVAPNARLIQGSNVLILNYTNKYSDSFVLKFYGNDDNYSASYTNKFANFVRFGFTDNVVTEASYGSVVTISATYDYSQNNNGALTTINTKAFTPTEDYHPSTKLYTDQRVQSIAPNYNATSTYKVGDYVSYQGKFYKCTTAIETAEAWNSEHWSETTVKDEMGKETLILNRSTGITDAQRQKLYDAYSQNTPINVFLIWNGNNSGIYTLKGVSNDNKTFEFIMSTRNNLYSRMYGMTYYGYYSLYYNLDVTNGTVTSSYFSGPSYYRTYTSGDPLSATNTTEYTPTNDYNPATKKYVDEKLASIQGYDATKTQTLKNINGVLTWQTDGE